MTARAVSEGRTPLVTGCATCTKRFGGITAVNDVSFDVYPGEILGLIGPNGCGKTTLFNCVLGQYRSDGGTVTSVTPTSRDGCHTAAPNTGWRARSSFSRCSIR